jgi:hypothetical protein
MVPDRKIPLQILLFIPHLTTNRSSRGSVYMNIIANLKSEVKKEFFQLDTFPLSTPFIKNNRHAKLNQDWFVMRGWKSGSFFDKPDQTH